MSKRCRLLPQARSARGGADAPALRSAWTPIWSATTSQVRVRAVGRTRNSPGDNSSMTPKALSRR